MNRPNTRRYDPFLVIWTALLASAAVPGILNPVVLMQKTKDGLIPWSWGSKFKVRFLLSLSSLPHGLKQDGSLRVDIPLQHLNLYFNGQPISVCVSGLASDAMQSPMPSSHK